MIRTIFCFCLLLASALAQQITPKSDIATEPHHRLVFENTSVRVFKVVLKPGEATQPHYHQNFYVFVALGPANIANEVKGRQPNAAQLQDGELRTSRGGFTLAERNTGDKPVQLIVVEILKAEPKFAGGITPFSFHNAARGELFENSNVRGYEMVMAAAEGRTEKHLDQYDRLQIALTTLRLQDDAESRGISELKQEIGEVLWIPGGLTHSTKNVGKEPGRFITLEFP